MKKILPHILLITFAIALILFVMIPAAFIALGKLQNPLKIDRALGYGAGDTRSQTASAIFNNQKNEIDCTNPMIALEAHMKDATYDRLDDESVIESAFYKLRIALEDPLVDWQYTHLTLDDEVASFVYKDTIVNVFARTSTESCNTKAKRSYADFHKETKAVEMFASPTYLERGRSLGLTEAIFRAHGQSEIGDVDYYWYLLDEVFGTKTDKPIATIWYSTRIGRTEYWFAFRTFKQNEPSLNSVAEEVLENTEFEKF